MSGTADLYRDLLYIGGIPNHLPGAVVARDGRRPTLGSGAQRDSSDPAARSTRRPGFARDDRPTASATRRRRVLAGPHARAATLRRPGPRRQRLLRRRVARCRSRPSATRATSAASCSSSARTTAPPPAPAGRSRSTRAGSTTTCSAPTTASTPSRAVQTWIGQGRPRGAARGGRRKRSTATTGRCPARAGRRCTCRRSAAARRARSTTGRSRSAGRRGGGPELPCGAVEPARERPVHDGDGRRHRRRRVHVQRLVRGPGHAR